MEILITDQGREFCNEVNDAICQKLGIDHRKTTAYHPQSNGQCERFNGTLCKSLAKYTNEAQDDWDDFIQPVLLAYRTTCHSSTKKTPYFLAFGREPKLLIEDNFPSVKEAENSENGSLADRVKTAIAMCQNHVAAQQQINEAQTRYKSFYDKKHEVPSYSVGQLVLLNNARRNN